MSLEAEKDAVELSKSLIKVAIQEADQTTAFLIQEILEEREQHTDKFRKLLIR